MKYIWLSLIGVPTVAWAAPATIPMVGETPIIILLIAFIFAAVFAEIKTAGTSGGIFLALVGLGLLTWISGADPFPLWTVLWFIIGIGAILMDIFLLATGAVSLVGLMGIAGSLYLLLGATATALTLTALGLCLAIVIAIILLRHLPSGRLWQRVALSLQSTSRQGYVPGIDYTAYLHRSGRALTPLRPSGTIIVDDMRLDVVTSGAFLPAGAMVRIISVTGNRILVEPVTT